MKNRTILYATGMIALTAILITCLVLFSGANAEPVSNTGAPAIKSLKTQLKNRYGADVGISIYFDNVKSEEKAKQIINELRNKLDMPKPKKDDLTNGMWSYGTVDEDQGIGIQAFYIK